MANLIIKLAISRPKIRIQVGRRHQELQHVRAEHLGADWIGLIFSTSWPVVGGEDGDHQRRQNGGRTSKEKRPRDAGVGECMYV